MYWALFFIENFTNPSPNIQYVAVYLLTLKDTLVTIWVTSFLILQTSVFTHGECTVEFVRVLEHSDYWPEQQGPINVCNCNTVYLLRKKLDI
jgi:hypothetical protein